MGVNNGMRIGNLVPCLVMISDNYINTLAGSILDFLYGSDSCVYRNDQGDPGITSFIDAVLRETVSFGESIRQVKALPEHRAY